MTDFTAEQKASLSAPLAREHVKGRNQGSAKVSYIEGWHAIAEANRIFGFDGWTRETVMSECCHAGDYEKAVWENGRKTDRTVTSFRCSYRARVRITVGDVVREGSGHGHGFADNPGEAHESAETDAMKRALMTFGNPFGLALYDKTQAEVEPPPGRSTAPRAQTAPRASATPFDEPQRPATNTVASIAARQPASPVEPPAVTQERQQIIDEWWSRDDYGINPEVIDGGLSKWDAHLIRLARAAPNLDAFDKLRDDNMGFYKVWAKRAAPPAVTALDAELDKVFARLSQATAA